MKSKILILLERVLRRMFAMSCALGIALSYSSAHAQPAISIEASDLADTTPGQDLWQYSFALSGFNFQMGQGFSVFFDPLSIPALQAMRTGVGPDWSILSIQPDLILRQPGYYDALALQNDPALSSPFTVEFIWQGQGTPGAQPFTIYNTDFSTLFAGQTVVVPEPTISALAGLALAVVFHRRRFKRCA